MQVPSAYNWQVQDRFLELHSHWMTLIGEHLQDHQGQILEYWRIEKADSVIVLPIQRNDSAASKESLILLPSLSYRPGVGQATLDFPGGRIAEGQSPTEAAIATLQRELGIVPSVITELVALNHQGWAINSSFSNQKLYGFVAQIQGGITLKSDFVANTYLASSDGIHQLLQEMNCLQCRAVLLEWWLRQQ